MIDLCVGLARAVIKCVVGLLIVAMVVALFIWMPMKSIGFDLVPAQFPVLDWLAGTFAVFMWGALAVGLYVIARKGRR